MVYERMSMPPPPFEHLGTHSFSFYPPIVNIEHNEWLLRRATWSEMLVLNVKTQQELWIPRRFLGEVSRVEDPVLIVGLSKELEYKGGKVWPHQRQVIEMPLAVGGGTWPAQESEPRAEPAPVVGIRLEPGEKRIWKLIGAVMLLIVFTGVLALLTSREGRLRPRTTYSNRDDAFLALRYSDDIHSIVLKLGQPGEDRFRDVPGEIQYRALWYPQRSYFVILIGTDRKDMHYVGAVDKDWNLLHSVPIPSGGDTASLVRGLKQKRF